jgi:hypothetical protein
MALSESELIRAIKEKERNNRGYLTRLDNYPQIFKRPRYDLNIEGVMQVSALELMTSRLLKNSQN